MLNYEVMNKYKYLRLKIFLSHLKEFKWYNWLLLLITIFLIIAAVVHGTGGYDSSAVRPSALDKITRPH